jgi:hypothetical protein
MRKRFLVQECYDLAVLARPSDYVRWREEAETSQDNYQPFALKDDLDLHIFCSEAPCECAHIMSKPCSLQLIGYRWRCKYGVDHEVSR